MLLMLLQVKRRRERVGKGACGGGKAGECCIWRKCKGVGGDAESEGKVSGGLRGGVGGKRDWMCKRRGERGEVDIERLKPITRME